MNRRRGEKTYLLIALLFGLFASTLYAETTTPRLPFNHTNGRTNQVPRPRAKASEALIELIKAFYRGEAKAPYFKSDILKAHDQLSSGAAPHPQSDRESGRVRLTAAWERSGRLLPYFLPIFASHGVPTDLAYLVFVESLFKDNARSWMEAMGLWQFMPDTARRYGLRRGFGWDERRDPIRATNAAALLLRNNFAVAKREHGIEDWNFALVMYNGGLWDDHLDKYQTTAQYLDWAYTKRRVCVRRAGCIYWQNFKFPHEFHAIWEVLHEDEAFLEMQVQAPERFVQIRLQMDGGKTSATYVVKKGDTLSDIARMNGVTLADLCASNGISPRTILSIGRPLTIGVPSRLTLTALAEKSSVPLGRLQQLNPHFLPTAPIPTDANLYLPQEAWPKITDDLLAIAPSMKWVGPTVYMAQAGPFPESVPPNAQVAALWSEYETRKNAVDGNGELTNGLLAGELQSLLTQLDRIDSLVRSMGETNQISPLAMDAELTHIGLEHNALRERLHRTRERFMTFEEWRSYASGLYEVADVKTLDGLIPLIRAHFSAADAMNAERDKVSEGVRHEREGWFADEIANLRRDLIDLIEAHAAKAEGLFSKNEPTTQGRLAILQSAINELTEMGTTLGEDEPGSWPAEHARLAARIEAITRRNEELVQIQQTSLALTVGLQSAPSTESGFSIEAELGDTIESIFQQTSIETEEEKQTFLRANPVLHLRADHVVYAGDIITIPFPRARVLLKPDDSLETIAAQFGTTVERICQSNPARSREAALCEGTAPDLTINRTDRFGFPRTIQVMLPR